MADITTVEAVPISAQYISDVSSSVGFTLPEKADTALVSIRTHPVHMEIDGTAATTSQPVLPVGVYYWENARTFLSVAKFIDTSAGTANISVWYFNVGRK